MRAGRLALWERRGAEMNQRELAERIGLTDAAISSYETDVSVPPVPVIENIASELGVTPGWLAFGQEPQYPTAAISPRRPREGASANTRPRAPRPPRQRKMPDG